MLFHFANAPLLPLVGQKLALEFPKEATAMMSFCMVAAQGVMLPIAILVGRNATSWGRRPIFLVAFAVLPIRAALYILSDNAFWLIGVQLLDGVGAGIYGALTPLVIADIMRGSGRFNLAQGAVATMMGIGASVSALFAGEMVDHFGYSASFLALAPPRPQLLLSSSRSCRRRVMSMRRGVRARRGRSKARQANDPESAAALVILVLTYVGVARRPHTWPQARSRRDRLPGRRGDDRTRAP